MAQMDADRWRRLESIVDAVFELLPDERTQFIDTACAGDAALRADVVAFLTADEAAGVSFLESPISLEAVLADATDLDAEPRSLEGEPIGPYRIVRELGTGGMGTVYLAERDDGQFEQQVALKLIRSGMDSDEIVRRFLHERQILARLQHPNIARLLDGGVTPAGQPYFALEHVDGAPITRYCDESRLDIDARLRLFEAVCAAVMYAHRSLVVHRDLKPSNILVAPDGQVKLLDFGIAKLLAEESANEEALTRAGLYLLTPEYAAPEQVHGEAITTATDVYALGCVLYELLTGHRAHRFAQRSTAEVVRVVSDVEPVAPSAAIARTDEVRHADGTTTSHTPDTVSRDRGESPEHLRRRLRGELDAIVLQALRKEPDQRYASVEALLEDLRRHAARLPIRARRDTLGYRVRKFVARHRVGVSAAALVLLSLVGGLAGMGWQARVASREAARAQEVTEFVLGLFRVADPGEARGRDITARELLDRGVARVDVELAGQPALQAELLTLLGSIHRELAMFERADTLLRRAVAVRERAHGSDHALVAASLNQLGGLFLAAGRYAEADSVLRRALAIRERTLGPRHPDVASSINNLGLAASNLGNDDDAERYYRRALELDRQIHGPQSLDVATDLQNLAEMLRRKASYESADSAYRAALRIRRARLASDHPDIANALSNLGLLRNSQGRYDEAEQLHREALAIRMQVYGEMHPDVALSQNNLASVFTNLGRLEDAIDMHRAALTARRNALGDDHADAIASMNNLATTYFRIGEFDSAVVTMREALTRWRRVLGDEHRNVVTGAHNLGIMLSAAGAYAEAEPLLRRALAQRRSQLGDEHPDVAATLRGLSDVLRRTARPAEAEAALREALTIQRAAFAKPHPRTATVLVAFGEFLTEQGRAGEAEPLLEEALGIFADAVGSDAVQTATARRALGLCLLAQHRHGDAEEHLLASHAILKDQPYHRHEHEQTVRGLVDLYESWRKRDRAAAFRRSLDDRQLR